MRYVVRTGCQWRYLRHDFPPWSTVYQQALRWWKAKCFESMVHDLRETLRVIAGRLPDPTAAVINSRTVSSTPESGTRVGYDGDKRRKGSKIHRSVEKLGHLLALRITPARAQVAAVPQATQGATAQNAEIAYFEQGYIGEPAAQAAHTHGIHLHAVKVPPAKRGFVLLQRRWVVERSFGWPSRFWREPNTHSETSAVCTRSYALVAERSVDEDDLGGMATVSATANERFAADVFPATSAIPALSRPVARPPRTINSANLSFLWRDRVRPLKAGRFVHNVDCANQ